MPSRRSHTKSRRGCFQCKRRHVKCDEDLPRCTLCKKRGLECTYPPTSEGDGQFPPTPQGSISDSTRPDADWPIQTRMLEMRLFHHYVIDASSTLRQDVLDPGHFQVAVPRLATSNPFLLDILLAFSALHLAFLEQGEPKWLEIALKYQNRACSAFSKMLAELAPESLGPAFICSIFIMLCAFAYPCVSQNRDTFDPLAQVLEIHRLLVGCVFLFEQLDSVQQPEEIQAWLVYKRPEVFVDKGVFEDAQDKSALELLQRDLLQSLDRVRDAIDAADGPHQTMYQSAWETLHEMIKEWPRGKARGGILAFPIYISEDFMARLKDGDWTARILFLHYGVGMHLLSNKWYVGIWGRRLVATVFQPGEEIPAPWEETVRWARRAVGCDPVELEIGKEAPKMALAEGGYSAQDVEKQAKPVLPARYGNPPGDPRMQISSHYGVTQPLLPKHSPSDPSASFHKHTSTHSTASRLTMSRVLRLSLCTTLLLVLLVVYTPGVFPSPLASDRYDPSSPPHGRARVLGLEDGKRGAVASESAICSRHGTDIILIGGNAADAVSVWLVSVGMYHSGIGGGGFMLVKSPNGTFEYIDFRETAPAAAFEEMFNSNTGASTSGGLASGVPGELRGLEYLHNNYGSLPWSVVVQPAIDTARYGFPVGEDLVYYMDSAIGDDEDFLVNDPSWAVDFAPHGTRVKLGDTITRKRYADTLETIAEHGPDAFYTGPIAESMIKALQAKNGTMTLEDLRNYTAAVRDFAQITYRGYQVTSTTAPSSGSVALNMLKVLDTYEPLFTERNVNLSTHRMDEAMRFGYGLRTQLGDPYFVEGMTEYEKGMLEAQTINDIRGKISDLRTQNVSAYNPAGIESLETPGTSHIATIDHSGLAISAITTINLLFGSKVMVPETGIIMNNEMDDFSTPNSSNSFGYIPSESNFIRPGKRPLSSCTPAIVTYPNGTTTFFLAGSAGGSRIITATVQNIIHAVDEGLSAAAALARPRLHDQLVPNRVQFEYGYDNATVAFMRERGHNVTWMAPGTSTAQAIRVLRNGTFDAAGEPRQKDSGGFAV
ncbi:nucleophile aminohydrolase [Aspergillus granulosus]|uniref:Glutathione hydrolase n=1 Tax=Aspergillus granulosus TaxID=176169 RepID=A0ABR4H2G7_9EURO